MILSARSPKEGVKGAANKTTHQTPSRRQSKHSGVQQAQGCIRGSGRCSSGGGSSEFTPAAAAAHFSSTPCSCERLMSMRAVMR